METFLSKESQLQKKNKFQIENYQRESLPSKYNIQYFLLYY